MPVLETIAAANAAFAVIKKCVENGSDIVNAGKAIAAFVTGKEELQRKVAGKDKSKATGSDLEAFMQLEKLNQQEQELKKMMIYLGRPGLWGDYQKFCAQARRARREEEKQRMKKRDHVSVAHHQVPTKNLAPRAENGNGAPASRGSGSSQDHRPGSGRVLRESSCFLTTPFLLQSV